MNPTDEIPADIPADLADAVLRAAEVVPAGRHSLSEMHRRRRLHQRRRTVAVAGVATVAVAAGAAGVPALFRSSGPPAPGPAASATAAPTAAPAQRLILGNVTLSMDVPGGTVGVTAPPGIVEIDAAGHVVGHPFTGVDSVDQVVALPDGRFVILGPRNLRPGVAREDGPDVTDLEFRLILGRYDRDVRVRGEEVRLVGATAEGAYLLRAGRRLVLHEFATGTERPLDAATAAVAAATGPSVADEERIDRSVLVQNGYLIFRTFAPGLRIHIVDLTTGTDVVPPVALGEQGVELLRLSPDGRTLALVAGTGPRHRVVTIDVATGRTARRPDFAVFDREAKAFVLAGMAFSDNRTVRVAYYTLPIAARVFPVSDLLKITSTTV